jgi:hypothetical protein
MRKTPVVLFFTAALALISLAACAPAKSPTPVATATATLPPVSSSTQASAAGCRVESSLIPTPDATQLAQYPGPTGEDWTQGPADAAVTFIEYGDYQ